MTEPGCDLILGTNTLKELGIILNFQTKEIDIDDIVLPMKNITSLTNTSKIKEAWAVSNALAQEPVSTELANSTCNENPRCKLQKGRPPGSCQR